MLWLCICGQIEEWERIEWIELWRVKGKCDCFSLPPLKKYFPVLHFPLSLSLSFSFSLSLSLYSLHSTYLLHPVARRWEWRSFFQHIGEEIAETVKCYPLHWPFLSSRKRKGFPSLSLVSSFWSFSSFFFFHFSFSFSLSQLSLTLSLALSTTATAVTPCMYWLSLFSRLFSLSHSFHSIFGAEPAWMSATSTTARAAARARHL